MKMNVSATVTFVCTISTILYLDIQWCLTYIDHEYPIILHIICDNEKRYKHLRFKTVGRLFALHQAAGGEASGLFQPRRNRTEALLQVMMLSKSGECRVLVVSFPIEMAISG